MIRSLLLVAAVSMDGFAAALGIGSSGIRLPLRSAVIISLTGTLFLGIPAALSGAVKIALSGNICCIISCILLMILGITDLLRNFFKGILTRKGVSGKDPAMILFDGTAADRDDSKSISAKEAAVLAAVLSADSAVTGIGAGLGEISLPTLCLLTFTVGLLSLIAGHKLGEKLCSRTDHDLSWLCGVMLIILALMNIRDIF